MHYLHLVDIYSRPRLFRGVDYTEIYEDVLELELSGFISDLFEGVEREWELPVISREVLLGKFGVPKFASYFEPSYEPTPGNSNSYP